MTVIFENTNRSWSDQSLEKSICLFKEKEDHKGLVHFLETRLRDEEPACVASRSRFWNELGLSRIELEDFDQAMICFENALLIRSDYVVARYNAATLAMQTGDLENALKQFGCILAENDAHFDALVNSGHCYVHLEKHEAASTLFTRALALRPDHGQLLFLAGASLLQLGRYEDALPHFRKAHKINDGHFESTQGLAISLLETKHYDEAIIRCDQALMTFGLAALPLQIKGDALIEMDRIEEAVSCHVDLCNMDLDIRDFVVIRIQRLRERNPEGFQRYVKVVSENYPQFETFLGAALNATI
ncbi:tetratricopeptide repeat protein [bacterium]|nr:tetratricopeptide repeat protein [bacterium]